MAIERSIVSFLTKCC